MFCSSRSILISRLIPCSPCLLLMPGRLCGRSLYQLCLGMQAHSLRVFRGPSPWPEGRFLSAPGHRSPMLMVRLRCSFQIQEHGIAMPGRSCCWC